MRAFCTTCKQEKSAEQGKKSLHNKLAWYFMHMLWWYSTHKKFPGTKVAELEEENLWDHSMVIGHQPSTVVGLWLKTHIVISSISM
jgi:hypothetical protein